VGIAIRLRAGRSVF